MTDRFRQAMLASAVGTCFVALDGRFIEVNPALCEILGRDHDELLACTWPELTHPDDVGDNQSQARAIAEGRVLAYRARKRYLRPDGTIVWCDLSVAGAVGGTGAVEFFITQVIDVTSRVVAERELQKTSALLRATTDAMLDPQALLQPKFGADGRVEDLEYVEVNAALCEYLQAPREALIGVSVVETLPGFDRGWIRKTMHRVLTTGEPFIGDDLEYHSARLESTRRIDLRITEADQQLVVTWRDATERHEAARRVAASEESYRLLAENMLDVVARTVAGSVVWISPSVAEVLGGSPESWLGVHVESIIHEEDLARLRDVFAGHDAGIVARVRARTVDGSYHWVEIHAKPYVDALGRVDGHIASFRNVDAEVRSEQALQRLARFDTVTGLLNRHEGMRRVEEVTMRRRYPGHAVAALFCDLDDFKDINDNYGHSAGDEVLRVVADRIAACVRADDVVLRLGGDELLVVLVDVHGLDDALAVAEKIRSGVQESMAIGGLSISPRMSIGATLAGHEEPVDAVIARADAAMYDAKSAGRDQVAFRLSP